MVSVQINVGSQGFQRLGWQWTSSIVQFCVFVQLFVHLFKQVTIYFSH